MTFIFKSATADDKAAGIIDHAENPVTRAMAEAVATQQDANFGMVIDICQKPCPVCKSPGFNDGWGLWVHLCGARVTRTGDISTDCPVGRRDE